jgi:hypothetical protein
MLSISMLVMCLEQAMQIAPCQQPPPQHQLKLNHGWEIEAIYSQELERTRRSRTLLEAYIEKLQSDLREIPAMYTPKEDIRVRQRIEDWRVEIQFMKRYEQEVELWEQQRKLNPGSETDRTGLERVGKLNKEWNAWQEARDAGRIAPPPREKK